jgi:methionine synthase II (cobalamin-independent)
MWIGENDKKIVEPPYEKAMLREVAAICEAIPHNDLCIQWDVCPEMLIWDDQPRFIYADKLSHDEIINRLARLAAAVPNDVELGFHLCYGDLDAKHVFDPVDAGKMVELANALFSAVERPVSYIHMPVPINRSDEAYFAPFQQLKKPAETQIFLGVVHGEDGVEGTKKRIAAASRHVREFGIATECGISRSRSPELVEKLLAIHRDASREPN